jgi:hypothetical protein
MRSAGRISRVCADQESVVWPGTVALTIQVDAGAAMVPSAR